MKKVTAFIGSARRKTTYQAVQEFEKTLKLYDNGIDFEYVFLSDYKLELCQGCKLCFDKGKEFCPQKDDRNVLLNKLEHSDGIIFATPSYACQVSARMKNFIDRVAFVFHRPRFFGKTFTAIVTQGVPAGNKELKYLESTGENLGCNVTKGTCVWTLEPMAETQQEKLEQKIQKAAKRFYKGLTDPTPQVPSFYRLMIFRMTRTGLQSASVRYFDYDYYKEKGWFVSDYYYETTLGPVKKLAGGIFDFFGRKMFEN